MRTLRVLGMLGLLVVPMLLFISSAAVAQSSIEDALKQLTGDNGKGYMQPFADDFGSNMNAGFYHSAAIPVLGFNIEFDIIAMGAMVTDDQKTFDAKTPDGFTPTTFKTATLFGGQGTEVFDQNDPAFSYRGPDGVINTTFIPLAVPQLTIGSVFGTQALIRYVPLPSYQDAFPKSTLLTFGVRHSVSQWLQMIPFDVSASLMFSSYKAGDLIDFKGTSFGAQASKDFSVLTVYGGLAYENTTLKLNYTYTGSPTPENVSIELNGANTFRVTAGLGLNLGIFKVFADANFGKVTHFSGGIGFGG